MKFIFTLLSKYYFFLSFLERKVFIKHIKPHHIVLDVGSGDKPFWRSDVIVDKYLEDDQQRHSGAMIYDKDKIFIEADVEKLPFKDKVFDFVFCSHLLEHVENPDKALNEMVRVAKRGYIEVPNAIIDLFVPFPPHLWFCDYKDGILIFQQKEKTKNFFIDVTEKFGKFFYPHVLLQYLFSKYFKNIFITLYWEGNVKYRVNKAKDPYVYIYLKEKRHEKILETRVTFLIYKFSYNIMKRLFYKKKNIDMKKIMKKS